MKKLTAWVLMLTMMFSLCVPAFAVGRQPDTFYYEEFEYIDSVGDRYHGTYTYDDKSAIVIIYDETGEVISKAERRLESNYIVETIPKNFFEGASINEISNAEIKITNINDLIIPLTENVAQNGIEMYAPAATTILGDPIPGSKIYKSNGYYRTDYLYQGKMLQGEGFYRQTGKVSEYNRVSYRFIRNTSVAAVVLTISSLYTWAKAEKIKDLMEGLGVSIVGGVITIDWDFYGSVQAFEYQFKCEMKYNGRNIVMSEIEGNLEYLSIKDKDGNVKACYFDDSSCGTPNEVLEMKCSEATGYAAKAFNIKYISGSDPSLPLPVNGPVF